MEYRILYVDNDSFGYSYAMMTTIPLFIMIACSEEKRQDEENSSIDTMLQ